MKFCQLILIILFANSYCLAQYPYTIKINSPNPLPTTVIYDMKGDSKGYLWLATDKGLIKYNSRIFKILPFNNTQLKSVGYISEDAQGKIWCVNFYKQIFFVEHDSLKLFAVDNAEYANLTSILSFLVDDKNIYLTTLNAVITIDKTTHAIKTKIIADAKSTSAFQHSILFNSQLHLFNRKNQLQSFETKQTIDVAKDTFFELRFAQYSNYILAIERGKRKRLALMFDGKKITNLPNYQVPLNAYVYHLSVTAENEIWICTQNGAYLWDYKTGNTKPFFVNERVSDVVKDFQGNYWFSTLDNGLFKCPNLNCIKIESPFTNGNDNATKIYKLPNNNFLVGNTKGDVAEINQNAELVKKFQSATNEEIEFLYYSNKNNQVYTDGGMFDYKTGKLITSYEFGKTVSEDSFGNLIISTFNRAMFVTNSFNKIDTTTLPTGKLLYKKFDVCKIAIAGKPLRKALLLRIKRSTYCLADKSNNGFWVAYDDDLYYYSYSGSIQIIKDKNNKSILATHLLQYNNKLYASTTTNGLIILNEYNVQENHFTTSNGLQSNNARKAIVDENKIWLLTDESLEMIDVESNVVQDFFTTTGLEFLTVYDFTLQDNKVLFATPNGIMQYAITDNTVSKTITITELNVTSKGKKLEPNATLAFSSNSIDISLDAIHYKAPEKLFFNYRLIGIDTSWQKNNVSNNIISYKTLPAGNYTFEVFAADINNFFVSKHCTFSFIISKPVWQQWWFIFLLVISLFGIGLLGFKIWIAQFKRKQQAKENLLQSKLTAIRSQMNPHFLYNVLNTVQGLVYSNKKSEAAEMLGNFSDLMRKTLQESDKTEIVLSDEIESLKLYLTLEKKRFDSDFEFAININESIDITDIHIPSMFIQPFAENATKHGLLHKDGLKKLVISIEQQENSLLINIDDNGIGRKQSSIINQNKKVKSTGFAIKGVEERISIYNEMNTRKISFEIIDKEEGTLIKLNLPIH